ncbi:hypothetical protein D3C75_888780 [compost metagenome]
MWLTSCSSSADRPGVLLLSVSLMAVAHMGCLYYRSAPNPFSCLLAGYWLKYLYIAI